MQIKKITLLSGDGIGPEVSQESEKLLKVIEEQFNYKFEITKNDGRRKRRRRAGRASC